MLMQAPWFEHYDPGVPHTLVPYPQRTLLDFLADAVSQNPQHEIVLFKGTRITCRQLDRWSNAFAKALLMDFGVKKGDRVALLLPNCPQFLIAELGAWKAGAIVVPLNPLYSEEELRGPLNETGSETIVVLTRFYERVKNVQAQTPIKRVVAANIKEYLPPHLRLLFSLFLEKKEGHRIKLHLQDYWLGDLLKKHATAAKPESAVHCDDPAIILLSGGTTGTPKGVLGHHRDFVAAGHQLHAWLSPVLADFSDIILLPLPLFHAYADVAVLSLALLSHNPLILIPNPRDLKDILHTIHRVRPAFFAGVPTLFAALLNHPEVKAGKIDFHSLKLCFSGASALLAETKKRFEELTGGQIVEGYSLTESMLACAISPVSGIKKIGSVGMPLPDVEIRIVDAEHGEKFLPTGDVGEIIVRAPQVMSGYWRNPAETAIALRDHGEEKPWLHTGDLGYMDEDGYLYIVDRKKDLIKTSGLQVWPREIEEVIATHPSVAEVGVAGVPDEMKGVAVKAWIVLRPGTLATTDEIRAFCKTKLAPYKVPAHVEFRTEIPKTMVGKVLRRALVQEHVARETE